MDGYIDDLNDISKACADASKAYEDEGFDEIVAKLEEAIRKGHGDVHDFMLILSALSTNSNNKINQLNR